MTTIAYRNGVMAADTLVTSNGRRTGFRCKLSRTSNGYLVGAAGPSGVIRHVVEWVERHMGGVLNHEQFAKMLHARRPVHIAPRLRCRKGRPQPA